jgi:vitamin B12 transporter
MNTYLLTTALAAIFCLPAAAYAQEADPKPVDLPKATTGDDIVVTADRTPEPLSRVGQSITVIDSARIDQRQLNTVAAFLREVPGVTVTGNGGVGSVTTVSIRGAESDQTVALIDGVKINDPSAPGGGFNFGDLLTGNIDRIEVLRGASSVLWGSQAIGGVVNLITRAPTEQLAVNARAEGGYRGTAQGVANVSDKIGPLSLSIGGGYFRTDGISAFDENRGGKEKDGYENYGANAKFVLAVSDAVSLDLRGYYSRGTTDVDGYVPPFYNFGDTPEYDITREIVGYGGVNVALFGGRFRNRFGYAVTDIDRHNYDPTGGVTTVTFVGKGRNERAEYQGVADLATGWQAIFGAEREVSRFTTSSYGFAGSPGRAELWSGYGQLVATPLTGLTFTGGVRRDEHSRFGGATTFDGSGVYSPNEGKTTLRASYSEGFKAPSLYQLQGDYGNQQLQPERSHGYDVGVTQKALEGAVEASVTWFHRDTTDLIQFVSCATNTGICLNRPYGTYNNVAEARSEGVEATLKLHPVEALTVAANYSSIDARNETTGDANFGKHLARRPGQSVNSSVDYRWVFGLETGVTVTHVGSSYDDAANANRLQGYVLTDIRASFPVLHNVSIYGRIENLFDEKYETALGYGTLGRAAYAGVRLRY